MSATMRTLRFGLLAIVSGFCSVAVAGGGGIQHHRCESKALKLALEFDGSPRRVLAVKGHPIDMFFQEAPHRYVIDNLVDGKTETRVTVVPATDKTGFGKVTLKFVDEGDKTVFVLEPTSGKRQEADDVVCRQTN